MVATIISLKEPNQTMLIFECSYSRKQGLFEKQDNKLFVSVLAALNISTHILKDGGTFVAKVFRGKDIDILCKQLDLYFKKTCLAKPRSSRTSSLEAFVVCRGFRMPTNCKPTLFNPLLNPDSVLDFASLTEEERIIVPYVSCGDLSGFDSDCSYPLNLDNKPYEYRKPVQPPINPPYEHAVKLKRANMLMEPENPWTNMYSAFFE